MSGLSEEEMKSILRKYIALDEQIKKLSKEQTKLKKEKKMLEGAINSILSSNGINAIQTNTHKFQITSSKNKVPLNKNYLERVLKKKISNDSLVSDILFSIENREKKSVNKLKKTVNRTDRYVEL